MEEVWKDIPGYDNYQVSNTGFVKSKGYWLEHWCRGNHIVRQYYKERILRPDVGKLGHQRVTLCRNGELRRFLVHQLVLLTFEGPCPDGMEVCHNDGDPSNNCLDNLRYDTRVENQRDKFRMFRHDRQKLSEMDVANIRRDLDNGIRTVEIAEKYGVGQRQIYYIKNNQHWAWSHLGVI